MGIRSEIEKCKTPKQVYAVLAKDGITIWRDDSDEIGTFSIWLDDTTRIYKPHNRKTMIYQTWKKININYSGIPTFFG